MNAILEEISGKQKSPVLSGLELFAGPSPSVAAGTASHVAVPANGIPVAPEGGNPLRGLLANDLQCGTCGRRRATHDRSFFSIPLALPGQRPMTRLLDCLHSFMQPEIISEVECLWCVTLFGQCAAHCCCCCYCSSSCFFHCANKQKDPCLRRDFVSRKLNQ